MKVYLKKIDKYNSKRKMQIKANEWWIIIIYKLLTFNTICIYFQIWIYILRLSSKIKISYKFLPFDLFNEI